MVSAPTPKTSRFGDVQLADAVMAFATFNASLGNAGDIIDEAGFRLFHAEECAAEFDLTAHNSFEAFCTTARTCARASGAAGAIAADIVMLPYDLIVGRGRERSEERKVWGRIIDKGFLGTGLKLATSAISAISDMGGCATGAAIGITGLPALMTTQKSAGEWISDHAMAGGKIVGAAVSLLVGFGCGIALDALRLVSLTFKYTMMFLMTLIGGIAGVLGGAVRACIHAATHRGQHG